MRPIDSFKASIEKAEHFLFLYKIVHNTRRRSVRKHWADSFKKSVHWRKRRAITRIDGEIEVGATKGNSILIFQNSPAINQKRFSHDYASELLRASVVFTVAAIDRYFHDVIVAYSYKIIGRKEEKVPERFKKIKIPIIEAQKAVMKRVRNSTARPGHIIKKAIQNELHLLTFQKSNDIEDAVSMLGISQFLKKVSEKDLSLGGAKKIREDLTEFVNRRNQIVHEADKYKGTKPRSPKLRSIEFHYVKGNVDWLKKFVFASDHVIKEEI